MAPKSNVKVNVRPVILLSILRKILSLCMINRCWERMEEKIPKTQAAYQPGRSTTEQVFTIKVLAEKAITSEDYPIHILMLDMSKAFDSIDRNKLLEHLSTFLEESEIYLLHILINDVVLNVKVGDVLGEDIKTNVGTCQGDCLSAILFIIYLAKTMESIPEEPEKEDYGKPMWSSLDWIAEVDRHNISIDPKYSDDINFIRSSQTKVNLLKRKVPELLKEGGLEENSSKREEYSVKIDGDDEWKKCKVLGSQIDTETDIKRRQAVAITAFNSLEKIFNCKKLSIRIKMRVFDAYVGNLFLYNCELWTTGKKINNQIDVIHRKFLRRILNVRWPKTISNVELYRTVDRESWSLVVRRKAFSWLGHLLRLDPQTPARRALCEAIKVVKKPEGRPKSTWVSMIRKSISDNYKINVDSGVNFSWSDLDITKPDVTFFSELEKLAVDRKIWSQLVRSIEL